jgi:hypothetical protein
MNAARRRIWGMGELVNELNRLSSVNIKVRSMPSGSIYLYGSNGLLNFRLGVVESARFDMSSFGFDGPLVE